MGIIASSLLLYSLLLLLPMCRFCTALQKKINYSAPLRDIELKFWGYAQLTLTGYLNQFCLILLAPVINTLRNKVRDGSKPTKIGYKIPQNRQKLLKFGKRSLIKLYFGYLVLKKIILLYTSVPIGAGGHIFHVTLFRSKRGLRDQHFQDK